MKFKIRFAELADEQMEILEQDRSKKRILKQVKKVLGFNGNQSQTSLFKYP